MIRQKVDYGKYRYSQKEILKYIGESAALCGAVDYLFYQTPWVMLFVVPVSVFFLKWKKKQMIRERKRRLNYQFRDALNSMSVAVQAGYSVENAVKESLKEMQVFYSDDAAILRELEIMVRQIRVQVPVEQAVEELSERTKLPDVESFAGVFVTAKRSGGNLMSIIRNTADQIGDKIDVKREIDTMLAAKKYEFQVMSVIPFGIVLYMTVSFPEFMGNLYGI